MTTTVHKPRRRVAGTGILAKLKLYNTSEVALFAHVGHKHAGVSRPGSSFFYAIEDDTDYFWYATDRNVTYARTKAALQGNDETYGEEIVEGPYRGKVVTLILVDFATGGSAWMALLTKNECASVATTEVIT